MKMSLALRWIEVNWMGIEGYKYNSYMKLNNYWNDMLDYFFTNIFTNQNQLSLQFYRSFYFYMNLHIPETLPIIWVAG